MEEIAHVFLGHKPNRLATLVRHPTVRKGAVITDSARNRKGAKAGDTLARDYNHDDEEAAYAVGAAALVPYAALRRFIAEGRRAADIARHFRVSRQLVEYRVKVTHLWSDYKRVSVGRAEHV